MTDTVYQQLRGHLHHLRLTAVADQLAGALEAAERARASGARSPAEQALTGMGRVRSIR